MAPMTAERGSLAAATVGDKVYAIGGGGPNIQLNSVEILDPSANTWMPCKSLHTARSHLFGGLPSSRIQTLLDYLAAAHLTEVLLGSHLQLYQSLCRQKPYCMFAGCADLLVRPLW